MQASGQTSDAKQQKAQFLSATYLTCTLLSMQRAAQYIEDLIPTMRKLIQKAETPIKKKGAQPQVGHGAQGRQPGSIGIEVVMLPSSSSITYTSTLTMMIPIPTTPEQ